MKRGSKKDTPPDKTADDSQVESTREAGDETLESLRTERDELLGRLQRVSADYLNYQKRVQRDTEEAREFANVELVKGLLDVLDDMERVLEAAKANHSGSDSLLVGARLVYEKALATLAKFGVEAIQAVGERFDPHKHQALLQQPSEDHPPGTVLAELQKGYQLKGRTIRPASVAVAQGAADEEAADTQPDEGDEAEDVEE